MAGRASRIKMGDEGGWSLISLDGVVPSLESDVDRVKLFRLTLRFFDDVSTAS